MQVYKHDVQCLHRRSFAVKDHVENIWNLGGKKKNAHGESSRHLRPRGLPGRGVVNGIIRRDGCFQQPVSLIAA